MEDQVAALNSRGIRSTLLGSAQTNPQVGGVGAILVARTRFGSNILEGLISVRTPKEGGAAHTLARPSKIHAGVKGYLGAPEPPYVDQGLTHNGFVLIPWPTHSFTYEFTHAYAGSE